MARPTRCVTMFLFTSDEAERAQKLETVARRSGLKAQRSGDVVDVKGAVLSIQELEDVETTLV